jgi:hypothetical protein
MHGAIAETGSQQQNELRSSRQSSVADSTRATHDTDVTTNRTQHRPMRDRDRVLQDGRRAVCFALGKSRSMLSRGCMDVILLHCSSDVTSHLTRDTRVTLSRSLESLPWRWEPQAPPERDSQTPFCESRFSLQQQRKRDARVSDKAVERKKTSRSGKSSRRRRAVEIALATNGDRGEPPVVYGVERRRNDQERPTKQSRDEGASNGASLSEIH